MNLSKTISIDTWSSLSPDSVPEGIWDSWWDFLNWEHCVSDEIRRLFYFSWMMNRNDKYCDSFGAHDFLFSLSVLPELTSIPLLSQQEQARINFIFDYLKGDKYTWSNKPWGVKNADVVVWRLLSQSEQYEQPVTAKSIIQTIAQSDSQEAIWARGIFKKAGYDIDALVKPSLLKTAIDSFGGIIINSSQHGMNVVSIEGCGSLNILKGGNTTSHDFCLTSLAPQAAFQLEIKKFEQLINSNPKESALQGFFESHPWFLWLSEYTEIYPRIMLRDQTGSTYIPDFLLQRPDGFLYDILDIKLPQASPVVGPERRRQFSKNLKDAIAQLREYRDFFDDKSSREWFLQNYKLPSPYKPNLVVLIGRQTHFQNSIERRKLELDTSVRIVTYDDILKLAQKRLILPHSRGM